MAKILVATDKPFAAIAVKGIREVVEGTAITIIPKANSATALEFCPGVFITQTL